jgi:hypothetical protein
LWCSTLATNLRQEFDQRVFPVSSFLL